jgi:hypothetical protein
MSTPKPKSSADVGHLLNSSENRIVPASISYSGLVRFRDSQESITPFYEQRKQEGRTRTSEKGSDSTVLRIDMTSVQRIYEKPE